MGGGKWLVYNGGQSQPRSDNRATPVYSTGNISVPGMWNMVGVWF